MSGCLNEATLIGNVASDPEVRRLQNGSPVVNFRLATNESWNDRETGERKNKAEFHSVVIFNDGLCKVVEQYVKKGSKLFVRGKLQTRKWTDQSGAERYSTEVVLQGFNSTLQMLDGPKDEQGTQRQARQQPAGDALDDEVPF